MGEMAKALKEHLKKQGCRRIPRHEESHDQIVVVRHLRCNRPNVLFTISPADMKLPMNVAKRVKAMGYRRGTTDLIILEARKGFHGLLVELKTKDGKVSPEQEEFMQMAYNRGYKVFVCRGADEAISKIENYLSN